MLLAATAAAAQSASDDATPFKMTAGLYQVSGGGLPSGSGLDVNVRYTKEDANMDRLVPFAGPGVLAVARRLG